MLCQRTRRTEESTQHSTGGANNHHRRCDAGYWDTTSPLDPAVSGIEMLVAPDAKPQPPGSAPPPNAPRNQEAFRMREILATQGGKARYVRIPVMSISIEADAKTVLPRHLTFAHADKIRELARRGEALGTLEAKQALESAIENGRGGVYRHRRDLSVIGGYFKDWNRIRDRDLIRDQTGVGLCTVSFEFCGQTELVPLRSRCDSKFQSRLTATSCGQITTNRCEPNC